MTGSEKGDSSDPAAREAAEDGWGRRDGESAGERRKEDTDLFSGREDRVDTRDRKSRMIPGGVNKFSL